MERPILGSRALLFPGPQPPLSHLGVTLLRHVIGSGARYACYQLGLPMPEAPPIRIARLRLYLDAGSLTEPLGARPGGQEVIGALLEPGGAATLRLPPATAAAAAFHRMRLRLTPRRLPRPLPAGDGRPWPVFRRALSAVIPALNDAFLAEVASSLERRAQRRRDRELSAVTGPQAAAWRAGRAARLDRLGDPDLLAESWAVRPPVHRPSDDEPPPPPPHPLRGAFRERYREALDLLRPLYLALAARAADRGLLERPEDAFFIPFDLAADLELDARPGWLPGAVAANRAEYENQLGAPSPPETLAAGWPSGSVTLGRGGGWELAAVAPLE